MGQYLLEGLGIGIEDNEKSILKQVINFGKDVISELNDELRKNIDLDLNINTDFANNLKNAKASMSLLSDKNASNFTNVTNNSKVNNFTQVINAPKSPSRIDIYRNTKRLLELRS